MRALACFPPFAQLKEVRFLGSGPDHSHLDAVLGEAVRLKTDKLTEVETVKLHVSGLLLLEGVVWCGRQLV